MIYLDHNATSPLLPEVRICMLEWMQHPCNASSIHQAGQRASNAVRRAAETVAALVNARPEQVIFTSGATEANHLWFHNQADKVVAVGATEHPSLHHAAQRARRVLVISVDSAGQPQLGGVKADAYSLMAANHETGVVPAGWPSGPLHVDASAAAGRVELDLHHASVTLSAHKIGGPLGVGALIAPDIEPLFPGSQQRGRRGGTLNTPGIVGFAKAAAIALEEGGQRRERWSHLVGRLRQGILALGGQEVATPGVPTLLNVVFPGLAAEMVVQALDLEGVCVSAGAACASGSVEDSPVLRAMGHAQPDGGVRFSLGWSTTEADIEGTILALRQVLDRLESFRT